MRKAEGSSDTKRRRPFGTLDFNSKVGHKQLGNQGKKVGASAPSEPPGGAKEKNKPVAITANLFALMTSGFLGGVPQPLGVGGRGFEPRRTESESVVLPLDDPPKDVRRKFYHR